MSTYEFLLSVHVLAATIWVGGSVMLLSLGLYVRRASDVQARVQFTRWTEWIAPRLFAPTLIVLIVFGVLLVDEVQGFEFDQTWITLGFVGWFINLGIGVGFYKQEGRRRDALIEQHGYDHAGVAGSVDRVLRVARIDTLVAVLVVLDMTLKPGL